MGHARALLNITNQDEQLQVCQEIIARKLSVRDTEALVKRLAENAGGSNRSGQKSDGEMDPNIRAALDEMSAALGTRVRLVSPLGKQGEVRD